jgi:hypothetical protein
MIPKLPNRPATPTRASTAVRPDLALLVGRGSSLGLSASKASIPNVATRADSDLQGAGRPAALPSEEAMRRRGGSGG